MAALVVVAVRLMMVLVALAAQLVLAQAMLVALEVLHLLTKTGHPAAVVRVAMVALAVMALEAAQQAVTALEAGVAVAGDVVTPEQAAVAAAVVAWHCLDKDQVVLAALEIQTRLLVVVAGLVAQPEETRQ
jgi:beta-mannanase